MKLVWVRTELSQIFTQAEPYLFSLFELPPFKQRAVTVLAIRAFVAIYYHYIMSSESLSNEQSFFKQ